MVWSCSVSVKVANSKVITCLSSSSLLAVRQVTRCLVRLRKEPRTSRERCSREDRCSMKLMTRKPRFWIMCCCTVDELSTSSQMKPSSFELLTQTYCLKVKIWTTANSQKQKKSIPIGIYTTRNDRNNCKQKSYFIKHFLLKMFWYLNKCCKKYTQRYFSQ